MIQIIETVLNLVRKFPKIESLSIIIIRCNITLSNTFLVITTKQKQSYFYLGARCN